MNEKKENKYQKGMRDNIGYIRDRQINIIIVIYNKTYYNVSISLFYIHVMIYLDHMLTHFVHNNIKYNIIIYGLIYGLRVYIHKILHRNTYVDWLIWWWIVINIHKYIHVITVVVI